MKIIVLGSAAGGGFPQWNCNCRNCAGVRGGTIAATPRTQSSIAVSGDGNDWVLINASPDILAQIRATPALQPARAKRDSGIAAVMLMDAQIDHVTGLLMLREGKPLPLYCTASVWNDLNTSLPLAPVLSHYCGVHWHPLHTIGDGPGMQAVHVPGIDGLRFTPLALSSKAPPYSPHRAQPGIGDNIGLLIEDTGSGKTLFYAPGLGLIEPQVDAAMRRADCVLVDGTFWRADEMIELGFSSKSAADMGHLPQSGEAGMIAVLDSLDAHGNARRRTARRKILIHINNTNPILDDDSAQRALLARHGIEVAFDGMEIVL
ncbi:pyrroloquinoline quinone biosynthesis protein PqqB [Pseudoduganella umbonata]|uniref:Coenzyme PQQ synthesis protein B n=1 Tax=Pseudoduganella umbonata TaxID=864828 RepID=A0A4P8HM05_9BURK|nr:pyrroloquinoline quinone biosynthesis protein PqqB [Pseudoduganella umbonata]MBB3219219.1 pyrroloquinoline quinone biosynthesis protein B [Pseudoduganella umbonata]QCP09340.1 pyrroloquinoline quinone biosynthesis protein PqqB [Pseudoduganella umbonata]